MPAPWPNGGASIRSFGFTKSKKERISKEITRYEDAITKSEAVIAKLEERGTGSQAVIQSQIDKEQQRIDAAYARIQPLVDEQNSIITSATELFQAELNKVDKNRYNVLVLDCNKDFVRNNDHFEKLYSQFKKFVLTLKPYDIFKYFLKNTKKN